MRRTMGRFGKLIWRCFVDFLERAASSRGISSFDLRVQGDDLTLVEYSERKRCKSERRSWWDLIFVRDLGNDLAGVATIIGIFLDEMRGQPFDKSYTSSHIHDDRIIYNILYHFLSSGLKKSFLKSCTKFYETFIERTNWRIEKCPNIVSI